jgi:hypothetical protein
MSYLISLFAPENTGLSATGSWRVAADSLEQAIGMAKYYADGRLPAATHSAEDSQGVPGLPARGDDSARTADRHGQARLSLVRIQPDRYAGLEYLEILTGKGSDETDRQLYRFQDHGGREVGMRFDLTVPLARFAAQHIQELGTPFKRYHIATVWRGENTQRGRYREFMQCDFDTIGTRSVAADIETALVIHDLMQAIGFSRFTIRLNNRMVLERVARTPRSASAVDGDSAGLGQLSKIGAAKVAEEMIAVAGTTPSRRPRS